MELRHPPLGLACRDPIALERWYTKHFGFTRKRVYVPGPDQVVVIGTDGVTLELFPAKGERPPRPSGQETARSTRASATSRSSSTTSTRSWPSWATRRPLTLGPLDFGDFVPGMRTAWVRRSRGQHRRAEPGLRRRAQPTAAGRVAAASRSSTSSTASSRAGLSRWAPRSTRAASTSRSSRENATGVQLLLFDEHDDAEPVADASRSTRHQQELPLLALLRARAERASTTPTGCDGPRDVHAGHRFNPNKVLLDPYARGNTNTLWDRGDACGPATTSTTSMRSVVIDTRRLRLGGRRAARPAARARRSSTRCTSRGFTTSPTSGVQHPGTFSGVVEKIPYLKELGVTAVELLPDLRLRRARGAARQPVDGTPLRNYWGYDPYSYFAPQSSYCVEPEEGGHVGEFRDMVKALHKAGIEVILDVVFNHTSEGNHHGPDDQLQGARQRGLLPPRRRATGSTTWTTPAAGTRSTRTTRSSTKFIIECLEYWVSEMHVDGFRFDEGSVLAARPDGAPMAYPAGALAASSCPRRWRRPR